VIDVFLRVGFKRHPNSSGGTARARAMFQDRGVEEFSFGAKSDIDALETAARQIVERARDRGHAVRLHASNTSLWKHADLRKFIRDCGCELEWLGAAELQYRLSFGTGSKCRQQRGFDRQPAFEPTQIEGGTK
jgi:hypothetical protein